jgi:hypothetical protein
MENNNINLLDLNNDVLYIIGDYVKQDIKHINKVIDDIIIMMVFKHWKNARNTQTH